MRTADRVGHMLHRRWMAFDALAKIGSVSLFLLRLLGQ